MSEKSATDRRISSQAHSLSSIQDECATGDVSENENRVSENFLIGFCCSTADGLADGRVLLMDGRSMSVREFRSDIRYYALAMPAPVLAKVSTELVLS